MYLGLDLSTRSLYLAMQLEAILTSLSTTEVGMLVLASCQTSGLTPSQTLRSLGPQYRSGVPGLSLTAPVPGEYLADIIGL